MFYIYFRLLLCFVLYFVNFSFVVSIVLGEFRQIFIKLNKFLSCKNVGLGELRPCPIYRLNELHPYHILLLGKMRLNFIRLISITQMTLREGWPYKLKKIWFSF